MSFKALKQGEIIDIISPATSSTADEFEKIKNFVEEIGFKARLPLENQLVLKEEPSHKFPSFSAKKRFEELEKALSNQDSRIIWCTRGGYGSGDILPFLENLEKPESEKIFIGFSDISSLNKFLIEEWNWKVIVAPTIKQMAINPLTKESKSAILDLLTGKTSELKYSLEQLNDENFSDIEAQITGGCLSVLSGHFGTKNQIDWNDKILFLEDIDESGERLDRSFRQIVDIIAESKKFPKAIILGNFFGFDGMEEAKEINIDLAIMKFRKRLEERNIKLPILIEKSGCLGHSNNMMPLVLGNTAKISFDRFLIQKIS